MPDDTHLNNLPKMLSDDNRNSPAPREREQVDATPFHERVTSPSLDHNRTSGAPPRHESNNRDSDYQARWPRDGTI